MLKQTSQSSTVIFPLDRLLATVNYQVNSFLFHFSDCHDQCYALLWDITEVLGLVSKSLQLETEQQLGETCFRSLTLQVNYVVCS